MRRFYYWDDSSTDFLLLLRKDDYNHKWKQGQNDKKFIIIINFNKSVKVDAKRINYNKMW